MNCLFLSYFSEETIKELTAKLKDYDDQLEAKTEVSVISVTVFKSIL